MNSPEQYQEYQATVHESNIADDLVYIALGIDKGSYLNAASNVAAEGYVEEFATAEARLRHIEEFDRRKPTIIAADNEAVHIRKMGVGKIVTSLLTSEQRQLFMKALSHEGDLLEVEEVAAHRAIEME